MAIFAQTRIHGMWLDNITRYDIIQGSQLKQKTKRLPKGLRETMKVSLFYENYEIQFDGLCVGRTGDDVNWVHVL
jgi:hypothetical protein